DARHDVPRGGERVDLPDAATLDTDLRAVVVYGAKIAVASPRKLDGVSEGLQTAEIVFLPARPLFFFDDASHSIQDVIEEESEPDTLPSALAADLVKSIIPVAGSHQRQAVQPHPLVEDQVDGLHAVPVDGVFARRSQGVEPDSVLAGRQRLERLLRLQVGGHHVQEGVVAGCANILDNSPGQPQQVVRSVRSPDESGSPILQAMEPVDDVALGKLLGGVQQDLLPRYGGVHPDQVDRVLKLIAKAVRPASLIEPAPGPDALGQGLVLQPVQVTIELRLIGLNLERIHEAEPPPPGFSE